MEFICVGEIVNVIGLKGEVKLYPLMDYFDELLDSPYVVWRDGSKVDLRRYRQASSCMALSLEGVNNRAAAEAMIGRELGFMSSNYANEDFPKPNGGLAFRYVDREVHTADGKVVGKVAEVRLAGGQHLLVISDGDKEILIPAVSPILELDDKLEGTLTINPPEGLLDVHAD